jgi:ribosome-binding protein aMBF1 (putative translation factor)
MNGTEIKRARGRLGISRIDLSNILNVAQTTIYRWEQSGAARIDPLQRELALQLVGIAASPHAYEYGQAMKSALESCGPTYALYVLLKIVYHDWRPNAA